MLGLFGSLDLASRSLQTQQQGIEVTGNNIANVNNPAYARQRLRIQTSASIDTSLGPQGTGAEAIGIVQLRSALIDQQITGETSVASYLQAQQSALQYAETDLGQTINTQTGTVDSTTNANGQSGIAAGLSDLFAAFQSLSTDPSSISQRQVLLQKAADLASRFNQVDERLTHLKSQLDTSLSTGATSANDLLSQIANLNQKIVGAEANAPGAANDLRDLRQQKLEELAKLTKVDVTTESNGAIDIAIAGTTMVSGQKVVDRLQVYDAGGGQMLVRAEKSGTALALTGGSLAGTIDVRDGEVAALQQNLDKLASNLISKVNAVHAGGFGLSGSTGADFFTGTGAADIALNADLVNDPKLVQASGQAGATGNNTVALALAQLGTQSIAGLGNQTFTQNYSATVAALGESLSTVTARVSDEDSIQSMLSNQRNSVSGVSLDEEMTNMLTYQRAYQASAKIVSTVNELLDTVIRM